MLELESTVWLYIALHLNWVDILKMDMVEISLHSIFLIRDCKILTESKSIKTGILQYFFPKFIKTSVTLSLRKMKY